MVLVPSSTVTGRSVLSRSVKIPVTALHRRSLENFAETQQLAAEGLSTGPLNTRFTMLLHLPPMEGHGKVPPVKNGPALTGHGAEAVRNAVAAQINTLPEQLRRTLTWD